MLAAHASHAPRLADVPERLAGLLGARAAPTLPVLPLAPADAPPRRAAAVDGSNVTLADARAFLLGAYRAGAVSLESGRLHAPTVPAEVALLERGRAGEAVARALGDLGVAVGAIDARMDGEVALRALRALREIAAAREALADLRAGDLLLLDGPVRAREPDAPLAALDALLRDAAERGVAVVGVAKQSGLTVDGLPALAVAARSARAAGRATWAVELPPAGAAPLARTFAARLSSAEDRVFRFDVSRRDPDPLGTLARVAALCGHPAYPGYPSLLAMAHHAVLLDEAAKREILQATRRAAEAAGADPALWDLATADYHDVLALG